MSLVGPRPEVPECVDLAAPIWQAVLQSRPGITDPASMLYRREERILGEAADPIQHYRQVILPSKLLLNLRYLVYRTFWRDLKLIFITITCGLLPESVISDSLETLLLPRL
jgi:lipopolysaccharide/colanic/teichoic acid biosynthesis glycosyltransferase